MSYDRPFGENPAEAWRTIQEKDGRVTGLAQIAEAAVRDGHPDTHYPDAVYADVKRFLKALVGGDRGDPTSSRRAEPRDYERRFAEVVAQPYTGTAADDAYLRSWWRFDVACNAIRDRLCEVYDQMHPAQSRNDEGTIRG